MTVMEQMLYRFHVRLISALTIVPKSLRLFIEFFVFCSILLLSGILYHLHFIHTKQGNGGCISSIFDEYSLSSMENEMLKINLHSSNATSLSDMFNAEASMWIKSNIEDSNREDKSCDEIIESSYFFTFNKGLLYLNDETLKQAGINVRNIIIDGDNDACMSPRASIRGLLTTSVLLQDHIVMSWVADISRRQGYLRIGEISPLDNTRDYFRADGDVNISDDGSGNSMEPIIVDMSRTTNIISYWFHPSTILFKISSVITSIGIILATNAVVTSTLKETQERMIKFTFLLHHNINHHMSHMNIMQIVFQHMIESSLLHIPIMIGIHLCLLQFFREHFLSLLIFGLYWMEEIYCAVCVRGSVSVTLFRKISFTLFLTYNLYFFYFPFGFAYLAFAVKFLSLVLIMMIFFNHVEVPALANKTISALHPRATATHIPSSPPRRRTSRKKAANVKNSVPSISLDPKQVETDMFGD